MSSTLDKLVQQVQSLFWELAETVKESQSNDIDNLIGDIFSQAIKGIVSSDNPTLLKQVISDIIDTDFGREMSLYSFEGNKFATGSSMLECLAADVIARLAWERDRLIAKLLPDWFDDA